MAVEGGAVEDPLGRSSGISRKTTMGAKFVGVRAVHSRLGRIRFQDAGEVVNNGRIVVGSEISLVKLIVSTSAADIRDSEGGEPSGFRDAGYDGRVVVMVRADDRALPELRLALGDLGGGDGDGMGISDNGMGGVEGGLKVVVEPDHLER